MGQFRGVKAQKTFPFNSSKYFYYYDGLGQLGFTLAEQAILGLIYNVTQFGDKATKLSRKQIADMFGISTRTVTRSITSLVESGYLDVWEYVQNGATMRCEYMAYDKPRKTQRRVIPLYRDEDDDDEI